MEKAANGFAFAVINLSSEERQLRYLDQALSSARDLLSSGKQEEEEPAGVISDERILTLLQSCGENIVESVGFRFWMKTSTNVPISRIAESCKIREMPPLKMGLKRPCPTIFDTRVLHLPARDKVIYISIYIYTSSLNREEE